VVLDTSYTSVDMAYNARRAAIDSNKSSSACCSVYATRSRNSLRVLFRNVSNSATLVCGRISLKTRATESKKQEPSAIVGTVNMFVYVTYITRKKSAQLAKSSCCSIQVCESDLQSDSESERMSRRRYVRCIRHVPEVRRSGLDPNTKPHSMSRSLRLP
jgi:hypothetical protein